MGYPAIAASSVPCVRVWPRGHGPSTVGIARPGRGNDGVGRPFPYVVDAREVERPTVMQQATSGHGHLSR